MPGRAELWSRAAMKKQPKFENSDVRALSKGKLKFTDGPWETEVTLKGDTCTYKTSHNSGHFQTMVWIKSAGLVEYANGYGAERDGYSLKKEAGKK